MKKRQFTPPGRTTATQPALSAPVTFNNDKHARPPLVQSPAQMEAAANMARANAWAGQALKDVRLSSLYAALAAEGQSVYHLALADSYKAPAITKVDESAYHGKVGDKLIITATDNVWVDRVHVTIMVLGETLEEGVAQSDMPGSSTFTYVAAKALPGKCVYGLLIEAYDLPGNCTRKLELKEIST
ncbi:hypothetical protein MKQ68_12505 [Chitinophaga horti]|uniref:Uncharacterized protein n=1 Tax=Chitinophaga horti TaxID=2920382 RepID=A0ABY6J8J2_9BACT|nr:hypothetical protein [Chitinophaga horti]UYQ95922.1 hypothetical protein MKQ68_12505 [Chitinophaga horti]